MSETPSLFRLKPLDLVNKLYIAAGILIGLGAVFLIIFAVAVDETQLGRMVESRGGVVAIAALLMFLSIVVAVAGLLLRGTPGAVAMALLGAVVLLLYVVLQWQFHFMPYHQVVMGAGSIIQTLGTLLLVGCMAAALAVRYQPANLPLRGLLGVGAAVTGMVYAIEFLLIAVGSSIDSPLGDAFATHAAIPVLFAVGFAVAVYAVLAMSLWMCLPGAPVRRLFAAIACVGGGILLVAACACLLQFISDLASGAAGDTAGFYLFKLILNLTAGFAPALGVGVLAVLGLGNGLAAAAHLARGVNWNSLGSVLPTAAGAAGGAAAGPVAVSATQQEQVIERLKRLDRLHADGMLTPEEYQRKRHELIAQL